MRKLLSEGISVNATLIFSPKQAQNCLKAMKKGMEEFEATGGGRVESVISVFVSRFDRLLDKDLQSEALEVSKTGIYNAGKIYNMVENAHMPSIRTLFASTGVKGDDLEADYYMQELFASHCVNTAPLSTIEAYTKQSNPKLPIDDSIINGYFTKLADNGFDMESIYSSLLEDGLSSFEKAFADMLDSLK
jgi:transaldolase